MIKNSQKLRAFEKNLAKKQKADYLKNLAVFESLYKHAVGLGAFNRVNPLDGIEVKVKIARTVNRV